MSLRLPYALQKRGSMLLHLQCWLWGRDICRKEGNLLIEEGFQRSRPPQGMQGSSQYTLHLGGSRQVRLWGFGIYYGSKQGIYLNRYAFTPTCASVAGDVWTPKSFARRTLSTDLQSIVEIVQWITSFEENVLERMGAAYRSRCLLGWSKRSLQPREFLQAWKDFGQDLNDFAERHRSMDGDVPPPAISVPHRSRYACDEDGLGTQFLKHPGITQFGTPLFRIDHRSHVDPLPRY